MHERLRTRGQIDLVSLHNGILKITGWAASTHGRPFETFKVSCSGKPLAHPEVAKDLPSPDVNAVFPHLARSGSCRFQIHVPLTEAEKTWVPGSAVTLTPLSGVQ